MTLSRYKFNIVRAWLYLASYLLFLVATISFRILREPVSNVLLVFAAIVMLNAWIVIISDIAMNSIPNKPFWILLVILLPVAGGAAYLLSRKKLVPAA